MDIHPTSFGLAHDADQPSRDSFAVRIWDETVLAVLADGTGSSDAAREASERAVRSLLNDYQTRPRSWTPQRALTEFTRRINWTLHQDSMTRFGEPELVTTLSVAVVEGDRLFGLNVGDSRVYLARQDATLLSRPCGRGRWFRTCARQGHWFGAEVEPHVRNRTQRWGLACLCSDGVYKV
jgi:serine/threonine protein phosphatase PrpC